MKKPKHKKPIIMWAAFISEPSGEFISTQMFITRKEASVAFLNYFFPVEIRKVEIREV